MLVSTIWNNVVFPLDVSGNQPASVDPLDVLILVNELNSPRYSSAGGQLPKQTPLPVEGPYLDVDCDGRISPLDVLVVINHLNLNGPGPGGGFAANGGTYANAACSPQLLEGTGFATELTRVLSVPAGKPILKVQFETPVFDTTSTQQIRDAFEIEITDANGNPVVLPYLANRDASYNLSEGSVAAYASGTWSSAGSAGNDPTVLFDLSGFGVGTAIHVAARLVNNDADTNTSVVIRGFEFVDAAAGTPGVSAPLLAASSSRSIPFDIQQLTDISSSVVADYGRTSLSGDNNELLTELTLTNIGSQAALAPLIVVLENFSELDTFAMRPDGILPDGRPFYDLTSQLNGQTLRAGESIRTREIQFLNDSGNRFTYKLKTYGKLNSAPSGFISAPDTTIEAGKSYFYQAKAVDEDQQMLTYSKVAGPDALQVHPISGKVQWNTEIDNVGTHRITIRAADPYGLNVDQTFDLQVVASLQNRPPNFVSDPITDAIASSGFEITTVGVGNSPTGISLIDGFRGPRLVSINAGDQTVGVYAGENNDRFDNVTIFSTGEPKPTNAIFQSGYSVDVGLPPFLGSGDSNDVLGMDQGDFNGDGILDLVAITSTDRSGAAVVAFYAFAIMLGDGDGNFRQPQIIPIANTANASYKHLNAADLNGDGHLDVIVLNETAGTVTTILGNGDGTFGALRVQTISVSMNDYRLADINNDGILDLYGRNFNRSAFGWLPGVGDGTYSDFIGVSGGGGGPANSGNYQTKPYQAFDLEGDGDLDFVFGSLDDSRIELWTNNGSQNFVLAGTLVGLRRAGVTDLRVADFTGDGHFDIFYGDTNRDGYSIFVGNPTPLSFTYQDASNQVGNFVGESNPAGDDRPIDFDGDGDLDLVMGNGHVGEKYAVRVLINGGSGFFTVTDFASVDFLGQHTEISQESDDTNIVAGVLVGDYNRDGVVDLSYFTRGDGDFNGVGIIPGTRPGEFYGSRTIDLPTDFEVLAADFNGDGIIDLLSMESATMLLGNGDGTFQPGFPAVSVPKRGLDAQIADFNQDGILDIIASRSEGFYVALGNGNGTFNVSFNTAIPGSFYGYSHISNGDFNNDGLPDIIARAGVEQFIDVWLNQASNPGTFVISLHLPILGGGTLTRGFQHAVAEGDFNEDGFLDFAAGSLLERDTSLNSLKIYSGAGDGTFTLTHEQATYNDVFLGDFYHPGELQSGDVNEDGHLDVVSFTTGGPVVHLGIGDGTFRFLDQYFADSDDVTAKGSYLVDMDEDGHLDMVQLVFTDSVNVRRGRGDGTFNDPIRLDSIGRTNSASFADLDHDGHMDLVYARRNTNGGGAYGAANLYFGVRDTLVDILAVDLNGDGNEEILAINEANDRLKLFIGDNLGGLNRQPDLLTGRAPRAVTTADLDGDGRLELITANRAGRSLSVFSGSVATGYVPIDFPLENGAIDVAAADLDGDGNPDLVALDDTVNALWIYTGNGSKLLSTPVALALGDVASKLTLADATSDGLIDAVITLPETNRLMILPNRGLGFQPEIFGAPIYITLSSSPSDVQAVDLNADGHIDLISTLPNENIVSVLFGRGSNQFARAQQIVVGAEPKRVVLADADEDGRTDLIVTNSGDNTASVIYNRFDPNEVYRYNSDAIDPDSDTITYAIEDGPGGLIINSATGQLLWAASPDQVGEHNVTLSADDGRGGVATQSFKIQVEPARDNASPLIATEPVTKIGAGETFTYQASALDNDLDTIRYRLLDAAAGATIDPTTGLVEWDGRTDLAISTVSRSDGRIDISANAELQSPTFTTEGWFYFDSLPPSNGLTNFFVQSGTYSLGNRGNFALRLDLIHPNAGRKNVDIPFVTQADRWYHIALVVDDTARTVGVYVDGQEVYSAAIVESLAFDPEQNSQVGSNGSFGFVGKIDNFRHWTVARTADEIREGLGRHYDGDTRLVLDYRFDDINIFSVRDHSPAGNTGFRIINSAYPELAPGLANSGVHSFTIGVEDGRGGFDTQSFILDVLPELRGSIRGLAFSDLDGSGSRNGTEPVMAGVHLFIDANGNGYPDPSESQTTTAANGNYQFNGLLPGQYLVRVSPLAGFETSQLGNVSVTASTNSAIDLAIEQLALSQIRGQLQTEDSDPIAYWKVYADLDLDNERDDNEPMAQSDRGGNYALTGLNAGTYMIRTELPAGWAVATGTNGQSVTLAANAISEGTHFTLKPTNTSVTGGVHFATSPVLDIEARQTFRYASVAIGIHNELITYDMSLAPDGMSIDPATGLVAWRPTIAQVGEHLVILRATSVSGSISLHDFTLTVTAPNTPPTLTSPNNQPQGVSPRFPTAYVNLIYAVDLAAKDAESQTVTFSLLTGPNSATLDTTTGQLRWTPSLSDVGNASFSIELRDSVNGISVVNFSVDVLDSQPVATPFVITLPRTQVGLGQDYLSLVTGTDALGRPLSWTLQSGPSGMLISSNGSLRWTLGNNQLGSHSIVVRATNVAGSTEERSFAVQVVGRPVNSTPSITSTPATSTVLGKQYQYGIQATDIDSDPLAFALLEAPIGMSIHPSLGTIFWTPAADQLGESNVTIQVTDPDGATVSQTFKLKVSRSGGPPAITSVPPTEASAGVGYLYTIAARDAENDPLDYRLLASPAGMTIVETTGEIAWTPLVGQVGLQEVVIEVSDGIGGAVTQAFVIRVATGVPNLPPVISSTAPRFGSVGALYTYTVQATDPESTTITYSLGQSPSDMTIDPVTGVVQWTPTQPFVGKSVVTLIATDAAGGKAIESFELDVVSANNPPTIASTAPLEIAAGALFTYQVLGRDSDLDQLTYTLTTAPSNASIDSFGKITWPTSVALIGSHNFVVKVQDPRGGEAMQNFSLDVIEDVVPPKLSLIVSPRNSLRPWQGPFRVYARSIDNVAIASLTLSANGQDIPLDASGAATFTFEQWEVETIVATATTVDTNNNVVTKQVSFGYGFAGPGAEDLPTAEITSPAAAASVTGMVTISGTADHPDFGSYTLAYRHVDDSVYTTFHESAVRVTGGELGVWDTSLLLNDEYVIRLEVSTNAGVINVVERNVGLSGELKLGNFRLSFTDMVIPVAGIPIEITRIYDTLHADRQGDFGYGWRLEYRNTDLRVGLPKSGLEDIGIYSPLREGVKVYLNVPGQGRQGFTFTPSVRVLPGFGGNNLVLARPQFTPDPGVTSTLSTGTSSYLQVNELGELFAPGGIPYNPASPNFGGAYVLTTDEGIIYRIDGATGKLSSATNRFGQRILFSDEGIQSSDGSGQIMLDRDNLGRVTRLRTEDAVSASYKYDGSGNLSEYVDFEGNKVGFLYSLSRAHFLTEVIGSGQATSRLDYDDQGRIQKVTDAEGRVTQLSNSPTARLQTIKDALGNETVFGFDDFGNNILTRYADGTQISEEYDSFQRVSNYTDALGNKTLLAYGTRGELVKLTWPDGSKTQFTYDRFGEIVSFIDETGDGISYTRDRAGLATNMRRADGSVFSYSYVNGSLVESNSPNGRTERYRYNAQGLRQSSESRNISNAYSYDARGNLLQLSISSSREPTITDTFTYDSKGNQLTSTDSLNGVSRQEYDGESRLIASIDALGWRTTYVYDKAGNLISTLLPDLKPEDGTDNPKIERVFDAANRLVSISDPDKITTRNSYDVIGRVTERILDDETPDPTDNPRFQFEYDRSNNLVAEIDPNGNRTEYQYDTLSRVVAIVHADGSRWKYEYDVIGRLASIIDPLERKTQITLDRNGNVVSTEFPNGDKEMASYDAFSRIISQSQSPDRATHFEYATNGTISAVLEPDGTRHQYESNDFGSPISVTLGTRPVEYSYDQLQRLIETRQPTGESHSHVYDAVGNLLESNDFNNEVTRFEYDHAGRVLLRATPTENTRYVYSPAGRLLSADTGSQTTTFTYDSQGRIKSRSGVSGTLSYTRDPAGNITAIDNGTHLTTMVYDTMNRVIEILVDENRIVAIAYDLIGQESQISYANGLEDHKKYDSRNRLTERKTIDASQQTIFYQRITYDQHSQVTAIESDDVSATFGYDLNGRLNFEFYTRLGLPIRSIQHNYLSNGSKSSQVDSESGTSVFQYDATGRLIQQSNNGQISTFRYDGNGNLLERLVDGRLEESRKWNALGQLVSVDTNGDSIIDVTYVYGPEGLRESETHNGETVHFQWDFTRPVPELIQRSNGLVEGTQYFVHSDNPLAILGTTSTFLHTGHHGSVLIQSAANASVTATRIYSGYGNSISTTGVWSGPFAFAGEYLDILTGDYDLRARRYSSELGRFLSSDLHPYDKAVPGSLNRYLYANANPNKFIDPLGTLSVPELTVTQKISLGVSFAFAAIEFAGAKEKTLKAFTIIFVRNLVIDGLFGIVTKFIPSKFVVQGLQKIGTLAQGAYKHITAKFLEESFEYVARKTASEAAELTAKEGIEYILERSVIPAGGPAAKEAHRFFSKELWPAFREGNTALADQLLKDYIAQTSYKKSGYGIITSMATIFNRVGNAAKIVGQRDIAAWAHGVIADLNNVTHLLR